MSDENALKLLELIRRELGAEDAHFELGGLEPAEAEGELLWAHLAENWRVVVRFASSPAERQSKLDKLQRLLSAFLEEKHGPPRFPFTLSREAYSRELDEALTTLAGRAQALRAIVFDADSPVLWGASHRFSVREDVEQALEVASQLFALEAQGVQLDDLASLDLADIEARLRDFHASAAAQELFRGEVARWQASHATKDEFRSYLLTCRTLGMLRQKSTRQRDASQRRAEALPSKGYLARNFANIYTLALIFGDGYSELLAEAAILKALPHIERLVLALPPLEPPPRGGRLIRMPSRGKR